MALGLFTNQVADEDTFIRSTATGSAFGSKLYVVLGVSDLTQTDWGLFNFAGLETTTIPRYANILSATLKLYSYASSYNETGTQTFSIGRMTGDWSESSTYAGVNSLRATATDTVSLAYSSVSGTLYSIDVKDTVQAIINTTARYGLWVGTTTTNSRKGVCSRTHATAAYRPTLTVSWYYPNISVNVGGVWKTVTNAYVNVGGVWRPVVASYENVGGTWQD